MNISKYLEEARRTLDESARSFGAVVVTSLGPVKINISSYGVTYSAHSPDLLTVNGKKVEVTAGGFKFDGMDLVVEHKDYGHTGMFSNGTQAAQNKSRETVKKATEHYLTTNPGHFSAGKKMGLQSDIDDLNRRIKQHETEIAELRRQVAAKQKEIDAL